MRSIASLISFTYVPACLASVRAVLHGQGEPVARQAFPRQRGGDRRDARHLAGPRLPDPEAEERRYMSIVGAGIHTNQHD